MNFVRSELSGVTGGSGVGASNVAFGGTVNFEYSMVGVIILSIVLIVLAIIDFVSLIKQIVFFKQFKVVKESNVEQVVEGKIKTKKSVVFFVCLVDIVSFVVGVVGLFINMRSLSGSNFAWILYLIDGLVSVFAIVSFILLLVKLKRLKKNNLNVKAKENTDFEKEKGGGLLFVTGIEQINIDKLEYDLLKLKHLKSSKVIDATEFEEIRNRLLGKKQIVENDEKEKIND